VAILLGMALTRLVRDFAKRCGAVDRALTTRKVHEAPVPRLGGVAIVITFFAVFLGQLAFSGFESEDLGRVTVLIAGGAIIAGLGIIDDLKGADAKLKFVVQFAVAALAYWGGFRIETIVTPLGPPIQLGLLSVPFTMIWIAGVINALNLIDGLDGLAGGIAVIATCVTIAIGIVTGHQLVVQVAVALAGAVLGFLVFNFNPASIFMGDTGSMFLGFLLSLLAIHSNAQPSSSVALFVPIIALGIPIADTVLAMGRRAARGLPLFRGDRGHIHHRLLDLGLSHRHTVLALYAGSVALGASAMVVAFASSSVALWFMLALGGTAYLVLRRLGFIRLSETQQWAADRRRNFAVRSAIREVGRRLRVAQDLEEAWEATIDASRALDANSVGLQVISHAGPVKWVSGTQDGEPDSFRVRYGLVPERQGESFIELGWTDGRSSMDRDTEVAVEELCSILAPAVGRLSASRAAGTSWMVEATGTGR
jgi:UDP-GlcNAc:undecaprenyl-phosphate GlcNAc-1-phosphate transferase